MLKQRRLLVVICLVLLPALAYAALYFGPGRRFFRQYEKLKVGMTEPELESLFHRPPNYECVYRGTKILYYSRGCFEDGRPKEVPKEVLERNEIPSIYGAAQFLVGPDGTVRAFTWNGETQTIRTVLGDFRGDALSQLDDEILSRLSYNPDQ